MAVNRDAKVVKSWKEKNEDEGFLDIDA